MPSYRPITLHVVNVATGEPFEEYQVSQNGNTVECYIESIVDTEFKVTIQLARDYRDVYPRYSLHGSVDGHHVGSKLFGDFHNTYTSSILEGRYIGDGKLRRMKFSSTQFSGKSVYNSGLILSRGRWHGQKQAG